MGLRCFVADQDLTCGSPCLEVLPLSQQSEEVQHQVAEQLTQVSIESLICAG
jgi:hypothetical protein